jgi:hypothetical protein
VDKIDDRVCNLFRTSTTRAVAVMCGFAEKSGGREKLDSVQREDERRHHLDADLGSTSGVSGRQLP